MNRKRIIFLLTLCVAFTLAAQGQRFDWVRTYTGQDLSSGYVTNKIVGSCVDREGNYYFLGQFSPRATLCGVPLLPDSVIRTPLKQATVIAKLSPQGNLLWHKAIYSSDVGAVPCALSQLGDTAFMVQAYFYLPYEVFAYNRREYRDLYYLDTLIPGNNSYPMPLDSVVREQATAFITFGNDGHVIEQHFLCVGWQDSTGRILTPRISGMSHIRQDGMHCIPLSNKTFVTDSVGNIYVLRSADDYYGRDTLQWSIMDGSITALKILVDGVHPIYCPTQRSSYHNLQILKFSPHFDSLIASTYVFDSTWLQPRARIGNEDAQRDLKMDSRGNLYLNLICYNIERPLRLSGLDSLFMDTVGPQPSVMIKYNSNLQPVAMAQLSFTGSGLNPSYGGRPAVDALLQYSHIDDASNSVFVTGLLSWFPAPYATPTFTLFYNEDTLDLASRDGFWLRLDMDDLRPLSMGKVRADRRFVAHGAYSEDLNLATQHNRVFGQTEFSMGIVFGDSTIMPLRQEYDDQAFLVWGYDGTELFGTKFNHCGTTNMTHGPRIVDSAVYLAGSFSGDATFGTIAVPTRGATYAYVAQYVDTTFMTPYVMQDTRNTQRINWPQELSFPLSDTLVPLTATSTSGRPVTYTCSDTTVARVEGTTLRLLAEGDATVTASQEGTWQYQPATPVTKPLHVSRAGIETGDLQRFAVYPNPAHNTVYYHSTHEQVKTIRVVSAQGRMMTVPVTGSQVDISALPSGMYYIQFVTEFNIYNYKIVKL